MKNTFSGLDHMHIFVDDRKKAVDWYQKILGFEPISDYKEEDLSPGPWIIASKDATVKIAFFHKKNYQAVITTAIKVDSEQFKYWNKNLSDLDVLDVVRDHGNCYSLYFNDPFGHRLELSCYEVDQLSEEYITE